VLPSASDGYLSDKLARGLLLDLARLVPAQAPLIVAPPRA